MQEVPSIDGIKNPNDDGVVRKIDVGLLWEKRDIPRLVDSAWTRSDSDSDKIDLFADTFRGSALEVFMR